jgi:hypothetical protein
MRLPLGRLPLTGEIWYRDGTPSRLRLAVGLRVGSVDVGRMLDDAVTRASATELPADAAPACCSASGAHRTADIDLDVPAGASTIHIEIRASRRPAAPKP